MLKPTDKVVCCCRGGQVRSVSVRNILADNYGFRKVLACGLEKNDAETLCYLFAWADVILVVGSPGLLEMAPLGYAHKTRHLDVGPDRWGHYGHPELREILRPMIERLVKG